jgi:uncharacterized protein YciI
VAPALGAAFVVSAQEPAPPPKGSYLVVYRQGPKWVPGKPVGEQPLRDHGKYMVSLYAKGTLKLAGPFLDDTGGAMVLEAADEAEAKAVVAADPAVVGQVMVAEVHPGRLVEWEKHVEK